MRSTAPTPQVRADLETRQIGDVLAIGCDRCVPTAAGPMCADTLAASLPKGPWQRHPLPAHRALVGTEQDEMHVPDGGRAQRPAAVRSAAVVTIMLNGGAVPG